MKMGKGGTAAATRSSGLLPSSLRIISSCLKTVSSNAGSVAASVRSAGASVAASISVSPEDDREQVLWAGFDKLELGPYSSKNILLLGYLNGFQVLDVDNASNVRELVSKRDGPVTFLQIQPTLDKPRGREGFKASHPLLLAVAGDEINGSDMVQGGRIGSLVRENPNDTLPTSCISTRTVHFFSLKSYNYVHSLRFRSTVYMVRCSPRIVAVALSSQIYCFDAVTLENKFSVLTYPFHVSSGFSSGYAPMAVGSRWLAYSSNSPPLSNSGRLSPQNFASSPNVRLSSSSSGNLVSRHARKFGRLSSSVHSTEADSTGMVVVRDVVTNDVISQFKAHSSPISALCFDPSGTLLVTASIHGNNINVFRIMPTLIPNGSGQTPYDWKASCVHLYKLHRGLTSTVIRDICFSQYSQWIAVVSSRGTCHIYVLSPFGGEANLLPQSPHCKGPILVPRLTSPWWSSSSSLAEQNFCLPPSITLSVVSRIKNNNSGWINTVSNVAAAAAGKMRVPTGAIAAVFHNSVSVNTASIHSKASSLEYLLVYSPTGHLVQHELLPCSGSESCDGSLQIRSEPSLQVHDERLHVNTVPIQWWDVCRRFNWPEREDQHSFEMIVDTSHCEDNRTAYLLPSYSNSLPEKDSSKTLDRNHWFFSNAEVQINSGRTPLWRKSKICFFRLAPSRSSIDNVNNCSGGEIEIERLPIDMIEIMGRDFRPIEKFNDVEDAWHDSVVADARSLVSSHSETTCAHDNLADNSTYTHLHPELVSSSDADDEVVDAVSAISEGHASTTLLSECRDEGNASSSAAVNDEISDSSNCTSSGSPREDLDVGEVVANHLITGGDVPSFTGGGSIT